MESGVARALLESILERIDRSPETGQLRLSGAVSSKEFKALCHALASLGGNPPEEPQGSRPAHAVPRARAAKLNTESLKHSSPQDDGAVMCLDFGTAMSKAAITGRGALGGLTALTLGGTYGDPSSVFGLHSSLYISNSGRVHFGHEAIVRSAAEFDGKRRRADSIKQRLSQGSLDQLKSGRPSEDVNPTDVPFTYADLVVAYLAFFTDVATSTLESMGQSRYVARRFARPCWEPDRLGWAEGELRKMLARAQILADTFKGQWAEGIPGDVLKATIDASNELDQLPDFLVDRGIPEPVAAAASRVISDEERERGLVVVVDVGAGTTDFASFWNDQDKKAGRYRIWQISGTVDAIPQAGDTIDGHLMSLILEKAHLRPGTTDYSYASTQLSLEIRELKERLMISGVADVLLSNGTAVKVDKEEFEATQAMKDLAQTFRDKFHSSLASASESWFKKLSSFKRVGKDHISVVLTGGGAGLSMIQGLAQGYIDIHGQRLGLAKAVDVPEWISDSYPAYRSDYPRLAVAIGGAAQELPELAPDAFQFVGDIDGVGFSATVGYK